MHPLLVILILIAAFLLWLLCAFLYKPIGRLFNRLVKDAEEAINEENKENNERN